MKFDRNVTTLNKADFVQALTKCSKLLGEPSGDPGCRNPTTGIGCCASAVSGHAAAVP